MFPVASINIFINKNHTLSNTQDYKQFKSMVSSFIQREFSSTNIYDGIRITYFSSTKEEIGVIIFIIFAGIYQTYVNYEFIFKAIKKITEQYRNKLIKSDDTNLTSTVAIKSTEIIKPKEILSHLEKYFSRIVQENRDKYYDIDIDVESIANHSLKTLRENEYFLKCHRTTQLHDIDIKLWETRRALAFGLSLTSIVMLGVTLEECLKTVLKNNYEQQIRKSQTEANLSNLSKASSLAEEKYGDMQLYSLISALYEEKLIDEEERKHLLHIKDYIRNAFIHSDKSKIFSRNKSKVDVLKLDDNKIKYMETQELSMLQMSFAQGFFQKKLADENSKIIFYEIEEFIYKITKRFWDRWD